MINIAVLNGKISIHHVSRLYVEGGYQRRLVLSSQTDREFCDLTLSRQQVELLIASLFSALKQDL